MSETHTHLRSPEKLVRTYMHREVASNRNWREKKLITTIEKRQPAGHGPGKSIEKFTT